MVISFAALIVGAQMKQLKYQIYDSSHNLSENNKLTASEIDDIEYRLHRSSDVLPHYLFDSKTSVTQSPDRRNLFSIILTVSTELPTTKVEEALCNYLRDHQQLGKRLTAQKNLAIECVQ
jgi:hypothetical protein